LSGEETGVPSNYYFVWFYVDFKSICRFDGILGIEEASCLIEIGRDFYLAQSDLKAGPICQSQRPFAKQVHIRRSDD